MEKTIMDNYNESLQKIYDHVGFVEDWVIYPISDETDKIWDIRDNESVVYADSKEEFDSEDGNYYEDEIYTQRFYKKHIYEGKDFTMIFTNPNVDGMKYF